MARLFADENFPEPGVDYLRRLGHDVFTVSDAGRSGEAWPDHAGLVVCTFDIDFAAQAGRISDAIAEVGDCAGKVLRVNRPER